MSLTQINCPPQAVAETSDHLASMSSKWK